MKQCLVCWMLAAAAATVILILLANAVHGSIPLLDRALVFVAALLIMAQGLGWTVYDRIYCQ